MKIVNIENIMLQFDIDKNVDESTIKNMIKTINHFLSENFLSSQPKLLLNDELKITIINPSDYINKYNVMNTDKITLQNGDKLDLENFNPLIGYQIQHKKTGNILPFTNRFEIYSEKAAKQKIQDVDWIKRNNSPIEENNSNAILINYELVPIYQSEINSDGYQFIITDEDWDNLNLK